jgi:antibiotic biosynthesis monooxygenase (ABM) superfamily enzyme
MTLAVETDDNATVVITHLVRDTHLNVYENWLQEIGTVARSYPGHLGALIIRPVPGASTTYTIVIRFDTRDHLCTWMSSEERGLLIEKVQPYLAEDDRYQVQGGLDFWFTPEGVKPRFPKKWKQSLVTWSAIFPLVTGMSLLVNALVDALGIPHNYYLNTLVITGIVVLLMVYVVMPRYTRWVHRWLYA